MKQRPTRMICMIDDEKDHTHIQNIVKNKVRVISVDEVWDKFPETPMIITGNRTMLLSKALNRGYGQTSTKWSIQFGLMHSDVLWCLPHQDSIFDALHKQVKRHGAYRNIYHKPKNTIDKKDVKISIKKLFNTDNASHADIEDLIDVPAPSFKKTSQTRKTVSKSWVRLADHLSDTVTKMNNICDKISCGYKAELVHAAQYHDWGKAHPKFQGTLLAKLNDSEYAERKKTIWAKRRPRIKLEHAGFFHDLVGGSAMFYDDTTRHPTLSSYLVMTHHGRFHTNIPDITYDMLPNVELGNGIHKNKIDIKLSSKKYDQIFTELYDKHGPFILSYLEALLRIADIRSSGE